MSQKIKGRPAKSGPAKQSQANSTAKSKPVTFVSDWLPVGPKFRVQFTYDDGQLGGEWSPRMPTRQEHFEFIDAYRMARNGFMSKVASLAGITIACVELPA